MLLPGRPAPASTCSRRRWISPSRPTRRGSRVSVGTQSEAPAPFTDTVIVGSSQGVSAATVAVGRRHHLHLLRLVGRRRGLAHDRGPGVATTYTATYAGQATTSYLSDLAYTPVANGWGPVEKDRSNGEDAAGATAADHPGRGRVRQGPRHPRRVRCPLHDEQLHARSPRRSGSTTRSATWARSSSRSGPTGRSCLTRGSGPARARTCRSRSMSPAGRRCSWS